MIQEAICIIMMIGISLGPFILCHCISVLLCVLVRSIKFNVNNRKKNNVLLLNEHDYIFYFMTNETYIEVGVVSVHM